MLPIGARDEVTSEAGGAPRGGGLAEPLLRVLPELHVDDGPGAALVGVDEHPVGPHLQWVDDAKGGVARREARRYLRLAKRGGSG